MEKSLNDLGLSHIWLQQGLGINFNWFKNCTKQTLYDQYVQLWSASLFESSKCLHHRSFKSSLSFEQYLTVLPYKLSGILTQFRCRSHSLPIEKGCYTNIPREQRLCTLCDTHRLGDEYHYVNGMPLFL